MATAQHVGKKVMLLMMMMMMMVVVVVMMMIKMVMMFWTGASALRLIDVGAGAKFQCKPSSSTCPTLTATRARQGGFWLTKANRALSPTDSCFC